MAEFNRDNFNRAAFNRIAVPQTNAVYLPKPSVPEIEKFPLRIYDASLNLVAELDDYVSGVWIRRWRTAGEFEFDIPIDSAGIDYIDEGTFVSIYRGGVNRIGRVERMSTTISDANEEPMWTVAGMDGKGILMKRIALAITSTGTGYDTSNNTPAETACRYYITRNCIVALDPSGNSDASRNISILELETDGGLGGSVTYSARLENLHDLIESLLLASPDALGYETVFDTDDLKIRPHFKVGVDRSAAIKFTKGLGNIATLDYTFDQTGMKNVVYVGDDGEDASRNFSEVYTTTKPSGIERCETWVDGNDCSGNTELVQRGTEELASLSPDEEAVFSPIRDNMFHYMTRDQSGDWDLGDIVTMTWSGVVDVEARIIEVKETYGADGVGEEIAPTIGGKATGDIVKMVRLINKRSGVRSRV